MLTNTSPSHLVILVVAVILLGLTIWAIVLTARDQSAQTANKIVWIIVLLFLPVIGLTLWAVARYFNRSATHDS